MNVTVDLLKLRAGVRVLCDVVKKRSPCTALRCIKINATAETLELSCLDGEIAATYLVPGATTKVDGAGSVLVPAHRFGSVLAALRDKEIRLETVPAQPSEESVAEREPGAGTIFWDPPEFTLVVGSGIFDEIEIPAYDPAKMPGFDAPEPTGWTRVDAADLGRIIGRAEYAAARKILPGRWALAGLRFDRNDTVLHAIANDGHRMAVAEAPAEAVGTVRWPGTDQGPVPLGAARTLASLCQLVSPSNTVELGWSWRKDNLRALVARCQGGFSFAARLLEGRYPDWQSYLPKGDPAVILKPIDPRYLRNRISLAAQVENDTKDALELEFDGHGQLLLWMETETGRSYVRVGVSESIPAAHFAVRPMFLLDALGPSDNLNDLEIEIFGGRGEVVIRATDYWALVQSFRPQESSRWTLFAGRPRAASAPREPAPRPDPQPAPEPAAPVEPAKPQPRRRRGRPLVPESPERPFAPESPDRKTINV